VPWNTRYEEAHLLHWQREVWNGILQEHLPTAKRIGED
jgi:ribonuclease D